MATAPSQSPSQTGGVRVLVFGGRDFDDGASVRRALEQLRRRFPGAVVVHGGCRGADTLADREARALGLLVDVYEVTPREWRELGRRAGPLRNQRMLDSGITHAIQFPGGDGTADMRRRLDRAGVPVWEPVRGR